MKYRDHRGSLAESLATTQEITSVPQLLAHLNIYYRPLGFTVAEVRAEHVAFDARIDWDTYHIMHRLEGETTFSVAGMSDGPLPTADAYPMNATNQEFTMKYKPLAWPESRLEATSQPQSDARVAESICSNRANGESSFSVAGMSDGPLPALLPERHKRYRATVNYHKPPERQPTPAG